MRAFVALLASLVLASACSQPSDTPSTPAPKQDKPDSALSPKLHASYQEQWGEGPHEISQHRFDAQTWTQTQAPETRATKLTLSELRELDGASWAAVYTYTQESSMQQHHQRVDLFLKDPKTLWICRHPTHQGEAALSAEAGDKNDLEYRGCHGAPWRKLVRQDAR